MAELGCACQAGEQEKNVQALEAGTGRRSMGMLLGCVKLESGRTRLSRTLQGAQRRIRKASIGRSSKKGKSEGAYFSW